MNKKKIEVKVNKLFNRNDLDIVFDQNLNIVVGENGCGKSTVLKIMMNIINNDFVSLSKTLFDSIELSINGKKHVIYHSEIIQLNESKNEEFKFVVREALEKYDDFNGFYDYIINKMSKLEINKNIGLKQENEKLNVFLEEDFRIFNIKKYTLEKVKCLINEGKMSKCIFGSKMYLRLIFNMYNNLDVKLIKFESVKKSYYFSFVDLEKEYNKFEKISFIKKLRLISILKKLFINKNKIAFKFNNQYLEVYDKITKEKNRTIIIWRKEIDATI